MWIRRIAPAATLAAIVLATQPTPAHAQRPRGEAGDRRVARLMDRLRDELWDFRQELEFFRRAPEYQPLVELRYQIRNFAVEMAEARAYDEDVRDHARQMARAAREMYRAAEHLEDRFEGRNPEVRQRADALHEHAVEVRVLIGRLHEAIRLDPDDGPGLPPRGRDDRR